MPNNVLIITSSGGGGLLQSAIALEQELRKDDPQVNIIKKDLLIDWMGKFIGIFARSFYNWTQKSGNVLLTNIFVSFNRYAEYLFYPFVFSAVLYNLFKHKIDRIFDNQPVSTNAILKALRLYNFFKHKNLILEKIFVDLPTKEYRQLLKSVKYLSKKDKQLIKIFTIEPLLDDEKNAEEFWQKNCRISESQITYKKYIIRETFKKFQGIDLQHSPFEIKIKCSSDEEKKLIKRCFTKGPIKFKELKDEFIFTIYPEDKLYTILLGSQPSSDAVCKYTANFIKKIQTTTKAQKFYLFVFSDKFSNSPKSLFYKVSNLILTSKNFPSNFSIIPMSFQKDDVIAPLFHRSNLTITRSGGHTIMELMAVSKGKNFIHSEAKVKSNETELSYEELLRGIPCWELGNARYLKEKFNGDIVTPDTLYQKLDGQV